MMPYMFHQYLLGISAVLFMFIPAKIKHVCLK